MVTARELQTALNDSTEDLKSYIKSEIDKASKDLHKRILSQATEIKQLKTEVLSLRQKVDKLENYIDEEDNYERRDTLIFSGEKVPLYDASENISSVLIDVVKTNLNIDLSSNDLNTIHRLGRRPDSGQPDKRSIIAKFVRRDTKQKLIMASKKLKRPTKLYINESLTPRRSAIFRTLRKIKKDHSDLVCGCTTVDGKVYAFTPGASADTRDRRHLVNTYAALTSFCADFVKKPVQEFMESWNF